MVLMSGRGSGSEPPAKGVLLVLGDTSVKYRPATCKADAHSHTHKCIKSVRTHTHSLHTGRHSRRRIMRIRKHSVTRARIICKHTHTHSGRQTQQCPLQAAISMEIVLIVPTDHTASSQQDRRETVKLSKSRDSASHIPLSRS